MLLIRLVCCVVGVSVGCNVGWRCCWFVGLMFRCVVCVVCFAVSWFRSFAGSLLRRVVVSLFRCFVVSLFC